MLKGKLGMKAGLMLMLPVVPKKMVCPSAGALATRLVPSTPATPGLLSMMTGCPRASDNFGAIVRATISMPPPGGKPITMRTGLEGKVCAQTGVRGMDRPMATIRLDNKKRRDLKKDMAMILINKMR